MGSPSGAGRESARRGSPLDLTGIDALIFDKDGTLIDIDVLWGGWARQIGDRLDGVIGRPVSPDVFATLGFDPTTGHVAPGGPLATATMAGVEETIARVLRRWCPSITAARRATATAWLQPDPVAQAVPLADLPSLFGRLRGAGLRLAVCTTDDRATTDATLVALGIRRFVEALVCGDDGFTLKPAPDAVIAVCHAFRTEPSRVAVIGDTPADIAMARAAGAGLCIGVRSSGGSASDLNDADVILDSVRDLLD
jgi:HAD superfamily hydrolase (TIGR01509 family)